MADISDGFKYWRILVSNVVGKGSSGYYYAEINNLGLYDNADSTVNLATNAIATASSVYSGTAPKNAIDTDTNSAWENDKVVNTEPMNQWLMLELAQPKLIKKLSISHGVQFSNERIRVFDLQASNDKNNWMTILSVNREVGATLAATEEFKFNINVIGGNAKHDDNTAIPTVFINDWASGMLIKKLSPNTDGSWQYVLPNQNPVLVTYIGKTGYQPISHGGIVPKAY